MEISRRPGTDETLVNYHKRQFSIYFAFDAGDNYLAAVVISGLETFVNTE